MKVQPIENCNQNVNLKGLNRSGKIGLYSLITSVSMFMLANAMDTFEPENSRQKPGITVLQTVASVLGILGTAIGLHRIEQDDTDKKIKNMQNGKTFDLKG